MKDVVRAECRFVFHRPATANNLDTHFVKELLHYKDGSTRKRLRAITNFKRPVWVTKEHYRNHKNKKEAEDLSRLNKLITTESAMPKIIASQLGNRYVGVKDMRTIKRSPYVYGADVNSRTYIKKLYQDKYGDKPSDYEICVLDTEVDTLANELTIISICTNVKMLTVITKRFLRKISNKPTAEEMSDEVIRKLEYLYQKHIPKTDTSEKIKHEFKIVETPLDAVLLTMKTAHEWQPDIMTGWNITYDLEVILDILRKAGISPAKVFSDPSVPDNLKHFRLKYGATQKVTESGKFTPINIESQWHSVDAPATFFWIDAMAAHRFIRVGGKSIPGGYGLDNILKHELGDKLGKLKFDDPKIATTKGIEWHRYMTAERPLEYVIYNQWDVMSIIELDSKTTDLTTVLPMLSGVSGFDIFNSGPKRIVDAMHFYYIEHGKVLGTKDPIVEDKSLLGLGDWIVLLPSYRTGDHGSAVMDSDTGNGNVRLFVYDSDAVSSYPSNTRAANVSAATTLKEIVSIEDKELAEFRLHNINLMFGKVNALSYGGYMFGLPTVYDMMEEVDKLNEK